MLKASGRWQELNMHFPGISLSVLLIRLLRVRNGWKQGHQFGGLSQHSNDRWLLTQDPSSAWCMWYMSYVWRKDANSHCNIHLWYFLATWPSQTFSLLQWWPGFWRRLSNDSYHLYLLFLPLIFFLLFSCSVVSDSLTTKLIRFPFMVSFLDLSALQSAHSISGVVETPFPWNQGDPAFDNNTGSICSYGSAAKNLPSMQEMWVWPLGQENPLEKKMATHSCILAWRIP